MLGMKIHSIEPCGFNFSDSRFKRVIMDYIKLSDVVRYESLNDLIKKNENSRIVLMTTKGKKSVFKFKFRQNDIILLGRESKGVPDYVHNTLKDSLKIPLKKGARSLNLALDASISAAEALIQIKEI